MLHIQTVNDMVGDAEYAFVRCSDVELKLQLDIGAEVFILNAKDFHRIRPRCSLQPCNRTLRNFDGSTIAAAGTVFVPVARNDTRLQAKGSPYSLKKSLY